ncbi:MAG: N-acetyl sugar amidotransferase [Bacteroidia bacterium]|nr:N-acetyl sugar amidotransferase [Bacteroidia bacterium]
MTTLPQIQYLIKDVLTVNTDFELADNTFSIEDSKICYQVNNSRFREELFDFYKPSLNNEDLFFLNKIKQAVKSSDDDISSLRDSVYNLELSNVNWLKLTTFFINEVYLDRSLLYDKHHRISSKMINDQFKEFLEFPVVDILSRLFCYKSQLNKSKEFKVNFTCDFDVLNNWTHIGWKGFLKRVIKNFFQLKWYTIVLEFISIIYSDKLLKWNFFLNCKMFVATNQSMFGNFKMENIAFMLMKKDNEQYDIENNFTTRSFKEFLEKLKIEFNVKIGIHPNYDSTQKPELLKPQIDKFQNIFGNYPEISRFHYLRCDFPNDLKLLEQHEIYSDYSYGFADSLLFRGGRTFPLNLWYGEITQKVISVPLTIMDTSLNDYLFLAYEEALKACKQKILYSVAFGSSLTLLWHNHNTYKHYTPFNYHPKLFRKLKSYIYNLDQMLFSLNADSAIMCTKCILDSNDDPQIEFDSKGICNHCYTYERAVKKYILSEEEVKSNLEKLVQAVKRDGRKKKYDCIIGVSGGVDSTYVAYLTKNILGLRPLAIHLDNGWNSELAVTNIENTLTKLNIDLETFVIDWGEFRDLQLSYLKASVVDIEATTDHAIIASLYHAAHKYKLKYILQGENIVTEGLMPEHWVHNKMDLKNIKSIHKHFGSKPLKHFPKLVFLGNCIMKRSWV